MKASELADVAVRDLEPMLAAVASVAPATKRRYKRGGRESPGNKMWISIPGNLEVTLTRSLPLSTSEADLLDPYGRALAELDGIPDSIARNSTDDVALRAIAVQIGGSHSAVVESAIRFLFRCAASTYEGQPINLSVLVELNASVSGVLPTLDALQNHDWYALLGSGLETGVVINALGEVTGLHDIRTDQLADDPKSNLLRPDVFRLAGDWSNAQGRIALSLSRSRELIIHKEGQLVYIYRSGRWRSFPLGVALWTGWCSGASIGRELKEAVLASAIDASLGHHGACIAIVVRGHKSAFSTSAVIQLSDLWPTNVRSRLFPSQRFQELTRRQRLEILSMDGATVVDHKGQILTAGAIVAVPGGSAGGGRLAATVALANFGAALKVSQDGPIVLHGRDANGAVVQKMALA